VKKCTKGEKVYNMFFSLPNDALVSPEIVCTVLFLDVPQFNGGVRTTSGK